MVGEYWMYTRALSQRRWRAMDGVTCAKPSGVNGAVLP